MHRLKRFRYHVLAFFSGAVVLSLEILGSRLLAPYFGSAFFVWVNVIGTVLATLAIGNWLGGVLADRKRNALPWIFLAGAVSVSLVLVERRALPTLSLLGLHWGSFVAALLILGPPSIILGMCSPCIIRLAAEDLEHLGRRSGSVLAASSCGSIVGTFATGSWLIPTLTISHILMGLAAALCILALLSGLRAALPLAAAALIGTACALIGGPTTRRVIYEKNSQYYNIRVHDRMHKSGRIDRTLLLDGYPHAGRDAGQPGLQEGYLKAATRVIAALKRDPRAILTLGAGALLLPEDLKKSYPQATVDVVEIDPEVITTARRFFLEDPRIDLRMTVMDGRVFLNRNQGKFDVIYNDAYPASCAAPPQLVTREAYLLFRHALAPGGILLVNIPSAIEGDGARLLLSTWNTIADIFPHMAILAEDADEADMEQNVMLIASGPETDLSQALSAFETYRYKKPLDLRGALYLTDDFAPTEWMASDASEEEYGLSWYFKP